MKKIVMLFITIIFLSICLVYVNNINNNTSVLLRENNDLDSYIIEKSVYKNNCVELVYPQIKNLKNSQLQKKINKKLFNKIYAHYEDFLTYSDLYGNEYSFKTGYHLKPGGIEIKKDNMLLSIYYYGSVKNKEYYNFIYETVNIDMETGDELDLGDIVDDNFDEFISALDTASLDEKNFIVINNEYESKSEVGYDSFTLNYRDENKNLKYVKADKNVLLNGEDIKNLDFLIYDNGIILIFDMPRVACWQSVLKIDCEI